MCVFALGVKEVVALVKHRATPTYDKSRKREIR